MRDPTTKRRVKLKDIADATGLSLATVSLALNGKDGVSHENRQRVAEVPRHLNYERPIPKSRQTPPTIAVMIERLPVAIA